MKPWTFWKSTCRSRCTLLEKLQKLVNAPEVVMRGMDQPEAKQEPEHGHTWGDMTL